MLHNRSYSQKRITRLAEALRDRVYAEAVAIESVEVTGPVGRISFDQARELPYRAAVLGEPLGPTWSTFWFRLRGRVPAAWAGSRVDLLWRSHSEATLWMDGLPIQGLNTGPADNAQDVRPDATLFDRANGGEPFELHVEVACNHIVGQSFPTQLSRTHQSPFFFDRADLGRFDDEAWSLWLDWQLVAELVGDDAGVTALEPVLHGQLLARLDDLAKHLDANDQTTWAGAADGLKAIYRDFRNPTVAHQVSACGHAHLDTAWLWPIAESKRKAVRTFANATRYMADYPEFRFAASQAQHYAWIRDQAPSVWQRVVECVKAGQFIPVGGMWIEPDGNVPSGESFARQLLYGQQFFERELGVRCKEGWLPDTFGFNPQLPQLFVQAGIDRFLTQKLNWNGFTKFGHNAFVWEGLDGSQVLAHVPSAEDYNSKVTVRQLRDLVSNYADHHRTTESMILFGYGDGGGGPTREHLERLRRLNDLQGMPRTQQRSPAEFFDRLEGDVARLPVVVGEMYLEFHRGTYTSQAFVKEGNRRGEEWLQAVELLATVCARSQTMDYPREDLAELWRTLLVNQFHDILPGSSIGEVYDDVRADLDGFFAGVGAVWNRAVAALPGGSDGEPSPINVISVDRAEVAEHPKTGNLVWVEAPMCGVGRVTDRPGDIASVRIDTLADGYRLDNGLLRVELAGDGTLRSVVELASGRETLTGPGAQLELYDDQPVDWDAWNLEIQHLDTGRPCAAAESQEVTTAQPLRAEVRFRHAIGKASKARQTVRLDAGSRQVEIELDIDWRERHRVLKVAFPVAVRSSQATFECPFGAVTRATHFNTEFDLARYEVPAHRWIDIAEHGFGAALITDSKYGYSVHGSTLRASLLRAPTWPDPQADQGAHRMRYAFLPHAGTWQDAGVVGRAMAFNAGLRWSSGRLPPGSWMSVAGSNLMVAAIKQAEDSDAWVVRLYEAHGARGQVRVRPGLRFKVAERTDLLERPIEQLDVDDSCFTLSYRPYEIITVRLS